MALFKKISRTNTERVAVDTVHWENPNALIYCSVIPTVPHYNNKPITGVKGLTQIVPEGWNIINGNLCTRVTSEGGLYKAISCARTYCEHYLNAVNSLKAEASVDNVTAAFSELVSKLNVEEDFNLFSNLPEPDIKTYLENDLGFCEFRQRPPSGPDYELPTRVDLPL